MKLLITGGCGFLGSNLAAHALKRGYVLVVFDNLSRYGAFDNLNWLKDQGDVQFEHGDIRNQNDIHRVVKMFHPDVIFHLAGQVAMTTSIIDPRMDFETNTIGTFNLLEAVRIYTPKVIIAYASTNKIYGDLSQYNYRESETRYVCVEKPNGFDEAVPLDFHSPYGCSKGAADQYLLDYARIYDLKTVVFRHSSMYGGRQYSTYDQGWIGWFCQKAIEIKEGILTEPFTISGNGKQVRDILHIDDIITLYFAIVHKIESVKGQAYNIGGGIDNSLSLLELFRMLENELKIKMPYIQIQERTSDQKVFIADIKKINEAINWTPFTNKYGGIKKTIEWIYNYAGLAKSF
jgi:CDP-paratose 2-epimerase